MKGFGKSGDIKGGQHAMERISKMPIRYATHLKIR